MGKLNTRYLWIAVILLLLISPLGLLAEGEAWGEWGAEEIGEMVGFIPAGLHEMSELWRAPAPDYTLGNLAPAVGYPLAGALGVAAVVLVSWLLGRWLSHRAVDG